MRTYFARHTRDLDVDDATRRVLWDSRFVAIHFPEDHNGIIGRKDNESLDPSDYPPNAGQNVRALVELAKDGGYVLAEYHGYPELIAGRIDPETPVQLLAATWGSNRDRAGDPAILKGLPLKSAITIKPADVSSVWDSRPPRGTLRRWRKAGDVIARTVDGEDAILNDINQWQRSHLAWDELADYARSKRSVTYETLGKLIGIHHRAVKYVLAVIQDYCLENRLPPLTILVVNKNTGLPGEGFIAWNADNLEEGRDQVHGFNWKEHGNPFAFAAKGARKEDVVNQLVADPTRAIDVYAVTRVRGSAQMLFRDAMLKVYGRNCAFCGSGVVEGLEAAHLVPWSYASPHERLDVRNGILLTSWHHRLFDNGLITITSDYRIRVDPRLRRSSGFDYDSATKLDGIRIRLPTDPRLHPDPALITKRNELLDWVFDEV